MRYLICYYFFTYRSAYYDVAIVEVAQQFIFKETIYPICIPEKAMENNKHLVGKGTVVSGKTMKSSPLLGPFGDSEFCGFSLLKI